MLRSVCSPVEVRNLRGVKWCFGYRLFSANAVPGVYVFKRLHGKICWCLLRSTTIVVCIWYAKFSTRWWCGVPGGVVWTEEPKRCSASQRFYNAWKVMFPDIFAVPVGMWWGRWSCCDARMRSRSNELPGIWWQNVEEFSNTLRLRYSARCSPFWRKS